MSDVSLCTDEIYRRAVCVSLGEDLRLTVRGAPAIQRLWTAFTYVRHLWGRVRRFPAQNLAGKPFTVVGDGTQRRDFTFVTDVADAFIAAARSEVNGIAMNVGSGNAYSVNRLIELLGGEAVYIPKRPGKPDQTRADNTRIRSLLDWEPRVSFEEGVKIMLDNIEYWRDAPVWTPKSIESATRDWFRYLGGGVGQGAATGSAQYRRSAPQDLLDRGTRSDRARRRASGRFVVLAHGVFDLLHIGHIYHLQEARAAGDVLIVTLTADQHVNKGPGRPVFPASFAPRC